ncbi:FAD-dependent monooxygenase [Paraglaciecola aestuariivivens]
MSKQVVIAGAGIGGLCAALALAKKGFGVSVYEQSDVLAEVGAGLQLSPNAMCVLKALGIEADLQALAFAPQAAVMRHYKSGQGYFSVPLNHAKNPYTKPYLHIHRADLQEVLHLACQKVGVDLQLGCAVKGYTQNSNQVQVLLANQQSIKADVLIGADGIKSHIQASMLGPSPATFTGQVAWRGTIQANLLPKALVQPNANLWVGPGQHFVSYYIRGGKQINFVAVQERADWQQESWQQVGDIQALRQAFNGWHPEVTELLAATQTSYLWALFDRAPLTQWIDNKVALLGDACHPMLPFLAQGAAMAIEDSYVLAHCLASEPNTQRALSQYQAVRIKRTSDIQQKASKNAHLYHMSQPLDKLKLTILAGLNKIGLSNKLAARQLHSIYSYNVVDKLNQS